MCLHQVTMSCDHRGLCVSCFKVRHAFVTDASQVLVHKVKADSVYQTPTHVLRI